MKRNLPYPDYTHDPDAWEGKLTAPFEWQSKVKPYEIDHAIALIESDGRIVVKAGYVWDYGSGPAIDTPDMVVASLIHDVGCDLTRNGDLPWSARREFDKEFRRILRLYGTPWYRRWWAYLAVRLEALASKGVRDSRR